MGKLLCSVIFLVFLVFLGKKKRKKNTEHEIDQDPGFGIWPKYGLLGPNSHLRRYRTLLRNRGLRRRKRADGGNHKIKTILQMPRIPKSVGSGMFHPFMVGLRAQN